MICVPKAATVINARMDKINLKRFMSHSLEASKKINSKIFRSNGIVSGQKINAR